MNPQTEQNTRTFLIQHDIKPSMQRLAVMNYLQSTTSHPSAEDIFEAVRPICPTLSRTTVYNTLRLFVQKKAALMLNIDETRAVFDACTTPHAHFFCTKCGRIYDIPLEAKKIKRCINIPEDFNIDSNIEVSLRGVCKDCTQQHTSLKDS